MQHVQRKEHAHIHAQLVATRKTKVFLHWGTTMHLPGRRTKQQLVLQKEASRIIAPGALAKEALPQLLQQGIHMGVGVQQLLQHAQPRAQKSAIAQHVPM